MQDRAELLADNAPHILVVDDDQKIRALLGRFLKSNGFRVTEAQDAAAARSFMRGLTFDLVLLDVMMPGKTGLEVCQHVRSIDSLRSVIIIMLTAKGRETDVAKGLALGANAYVTKPFSTRALVAQVRSLLGAGA